MAPSTTESRLRRGFQAGIWSFAILLATGGYCVSAWASPEFAPGVSLAQVKPVQSRLSGMAASVTNPGVWWTHGDAEEGPIVYAYSLRGEYLGQWQLSSAAATDWEGVAVGPGPIEGISYVYVGDIGDKGSNRELGLRIYRFFEPVVYPRQAEDPLTRILPNSAWEMTTVTYPGVLFLREADAETMMVDPRNGDVYIAQKRDGHIPVFRAEASSLFQGTTAGMTQVADLSTPGWTAAGGAIQPQAMELIVSGPSQHRLLWQIAPGETIQQALAGPSYSIPFGNESRGGAVTYERNGSGYMSLSEGDAIDLQYFARTSPDAPTPFLSVIPPESQWRFMDNGLDQGRAWRNADFDDTGWKNGYAQLGYGEGDEQSSVSYGDKPSNKRITTYFRKTFCLDTSVPFETLVLRVVFDGGIAVYLNGTEILRHALASGAGVFTLATCTRGALKDSWLTVPVDAAALLPGENTIAVETHLASVDQRSMSFDLQLEGTRSTPARTYRVMLETVTEPPGLVAPSFAMDDDAATIDAGGSRSFRLIAPAAYADLPYAAFESTTRQFNLGAHGDAVCSCPDYADGGDPRCTPRVTATNARLYKGNSKWPDVDHDDWYNIYYPTGDVTVTVTYKAREIPVEYDPYVTGPSITYHAATGHSIEVTPAERPGYDLTGVNASSGVIEDLGNGAWRLSRVTDLSEVKVYSAYLPITYALTYNAGEHGTISGTSHQVVPWEADGTQVTAVPDAGCRFVAWSDGVLSASRTDTHVKKNLWVLASFVPDFHEIAYEATPRTGGGISGPSSILAGNEAVLEVQENEGYWFGDITTTNGTLNGTYPSFKLSGVTAATTVTASFSPKSNPITYTSDPHEGGAVSGPPEILTGESAVLTVTENAGYRFQGLTATNGSVSGAFPSFTLNGVTAETSVNATFGAAPMWNLLYAADPAAAGTVSGPASIPQSTGATATVSVTANPGYTLELVSANNGATITGTGPYTVSNVTADTVVTAYFAPDRK